MYPYSRNIIGTVQILSSNNDVIARMGSGDYFGEISILLDVPRTADARSVTNVDMYVLSKIDFMQVCANYPQLDQRFKDLASKAYRNRQQQVSDCVYEESIIQLKYVYYSSRK